MDEFSAHVCAYIFSVSFVPSRANKQIIEADLICKWYKYTFCKWRLCSNPIEGSKSSGGVYSFKSAQP